MGWYEPKYHKERMVKTEKLNGATNTKKPMTLEEVLKGLFSSLIMIILGIGLFIIAAPFLCDSTKDSNSGTNTELNVRDRKVTAQEAFIISQIFVQERLVAPATANFSWLESNSWTFFDTIFVISGYVDAQNYFGAQVRTTYTCKLRYKGGEWTDIQNWEFIDMKTW